jgi:two-component system chemotaxis response regulator CheB
MAASPIRVLLVEDSPIAIAVLQRLLTTAADITVVGTARTGIEALSLIPRVQPDVVCTDLHMPQMGGLELTREIMARFPRPILVISASVQAEDTAKVFELLQAGAVDVFPKPRSGLSPSDDRTRRELLNKIRILSGVRVFTQHRHKFSSLRLRSGQAPSPSLTPSPPYPLTPSPPLDIRTPCIIAIGASTGGPNALHKVLSALPAHLPVPVVCVQHISTGFLQGLVDWLNQSCSLGVKVAESGQPLRPGNVYFAPENRHLEIDATGNLRCAAQLPIAGHCPSATVLFNSVAAYYRRSVVAVLLTGMGRDGADGLLTIAQAGGLTIAQDEASSVVFGMPKEAIALGAAQEILPIDKIGSRLQGIFCSDRV